MSESRDFAALAEIAESVSGQGAGVMIDPTEAETLGYDSNDSILIAELERLRAENIYLVSQLELAEEVCHYFDDPDSDDAGQGLIELWRAELMKAKPIEENGMSEHRQDERDDGSVDDRCRECGHEWPCPARQTEVLLHEVLERGQALLDECCAAVAQGGVGRAFVETLNRVEDVCYHPVQIVR